MQHFRTLMMIILAFAFMTAVSAAEETTTSPDAEPAEINWMKYEEGIKKAKAEDKHVFIDFSTGWCRWCKVMDKETFTNPEVIKMVTDNFIAIRIDGDSKREMDIDGYKITEQELTKSEYGITGYPAFWFLDAELTKLGLIKGYHDADYMMKAFTFIKDKQYDTTSAGKSNQ